MNYEQAKAHNDKIIEQIKKLQTEMVVRLHIRVVERLEGGRRAVIENKETDYVKRTQYDVLYKDYRALYPDTKTHLILIEPLEELKRVVKIALPHRDDSEREPPAGMPAPEGDDPFAEI